MPQRQPIALKVYESTDQLRLRTWVQMAGVTARVQRHIVELLAQHDLTLPQFDVLATLRYSEGVTQQDLAERMLVTKGNICGLIDRLERSKLVQRRPDPQDARANRLYLTATGKRRIDTILPDHDAAVIQLFSSFSSPQLKTFQDMLSSVQQKTEMNNR